MKLVLDIPYGLYLSIKDGFLKDCIKATTEAILNGEVLISVSEFEKMQDEKIEKGEV